MNKIKLFFNEYLSNKDNKEVLQHSLLLFVIKVFFTFVSFLLSIIIARNLSIEESGDYFFIISLVAVLSTLSRLGLDNTVTRFIAKANAKHNKGSVSFIFSTAFKWSMFSSLFLSLLVILFGITYDFYNALPKSYLILLFVIILLLPITTLSRILQQSFQGMKKVGLFALFSGVARLFTLCFLLLITFTADKLTLNMALYVFVIASLISLLLALFIWKRQNGYNEILDYNDKLVIVKKMQSSCLSLWGISCLAILMADGVQIMVAVFSDSSQAAYFAIAVRIASLVAFILLAINGILSPKFAEISADNDILRLQDVYRSASRLMLLITAPILLIIFVFAGSLLSVFGEQFQQSSVVLRVLVIAQFFKVVVGSVGQLLIMSGNEKCQRNNLFFCVLLLMLLCVLLIPFYGALGGAIATLCAVATNNLLGLFQVKKKLNITLF